MAFNDQSNSMSSRRVVTKFWWLDVLWPLLLAGALIGLLTFVIYAGQRHMRLASGGEDALLSASLAVAGNVPMSHQSETVVISADERDLTAQIPSGPIVAEEGTPIHDIKVEGYARVLRRIAFAGPKLLVLSWTPSAHVGPESDYSALVDAMKQVPRGVKILLAYPPTEKWTIPAELQKLVSSVADSPCDDYTDTQLVCPFNTAHKPFSDWVIQAMLVELGVDEPALRRRSVVSSDIARTHPSFIVNVDDPQNITTFAFRDILSPSFDLQVIRGKVAFVGSNLIQPERVRSQPAIRRVFTSQSHGEDLRRDGTPVHVFWAQLAGMFLGNESVSVPAGGIQAFVIVLFCTLMLMLLNRFGDVAAIGAFVSFVLSAPFVNGAAIRLMHLYIPLFDLYYFGLGTLILAGFGMLSKEAFHRWRLEESQRLHAHTADLKMNFTSLISHNLNTPIAKLQGVLDMLSHIPEADAWRGSIAAAQTNTAMLLLYVKSVLVTTAIEENAISPTPCVAQRITEEFVGNYHTIIARLGVHLEVLADEDDEGLPVRVDLRSLHAALAALFALCRPAGDGSTDAVLGFAVRISDQGNPILRIRIVLTGGISTPPDAVLQSIFSQAGEDSEKIFNSARLKQGKSAKPDDCLAQLVLAGLQLHRMVGTANTTDRVSSGLGGSMTRLTLDGEGIV